jgi:hypothetical protein
MAGTGHGNTFQDAFGNWWNTGTPWVAVNWKFERRVSMFPAGFDADGQMYANSRFGDFPHYVPTGKFEDRDALFTGWMLLSYGKSASASSQLEDFGPAVVTDENPRTFWVAATSEPGETLTVDLGRAYAVRAVQVNFTDYKSEIYESDERVYTQFKLHASSDGKKWTTVADLTKENQTYQVWADAGNELEIRALNVGQDSWFAIESFDENGVSRLSAPVRVP